MIIIITTMIMIVVMTINNTIKFITTVIATRAILTTKWRINFDDTMGHNGYM
jgi:hypothetical protein